MSTSGILDETINSGVQAMLADVEHCIVEALGVTRKVALDMARDRRLARVIGRDGWDTYTKDGVPFLRVGPLTTTETEHQYHRTWTLARQVQRLS